MARGDSHDVFAGLTRAPAAEAAQTASAGRSTPNVSLHLSPRTPKAASSHEAMDISTPNIHMPRSAAPEAQHTDAPKRMDAPYTVFRPSEGDDHTPCHGAAACRLTSAARLHS